jgi:hypothetical protein
LSKFFKSTVRQECNANFAFFLVVLLKAAGCDARNEQRDYKNA